MTVDFESATVRVQTGTGETKEFPFSSPEAFAAVSRAWLRCGWDCKHVYSFTWLGRPIIQLPEDMIRIQEVIYSVQPDVIIETGVAHGGSLVFYASLCKAIDKGRLIGIDIEIRPQNRVDIETHPLFELITLVEGDSVDATVVAEVHRLVRPGETVIVLLDSSHTKSHVLSELEAYAPLVTPGSYVVAMDRIMQDLVGAPRTSADWSWNNPRQAVAEFLAQHSEFVVEEPAFRFNEGSIKKRVTYWPQAFIKRIS